MTKLVSTNFDPPRHPFWGGARPGSASGCLKNARYIWFRPVIGCPKNHVKTISNIYTLQYRSTFIFFGSAAEVCRRVAKF
jgi:hypothetical protein